MRQNPEIEIKTKVSISKFQFQFIPIHIINNADIIST